jgi:hypothetical protein
VQQEARDAETLVLGAFCVDQRCVTVGQLRAHTNLTTGELRAALSGLVAKGTLSGLNTVVESYTLRSRATSEAR